MAGGQLSIVYRILVFGTRGNNWIISILNFHWPWCTPFYSDFCIYEFGGTTNKLNNFMHAIKTSNRKVFYEIAGRRIPQLSSVVFCSSPSCRFFWCTAGRQRECSGHTSVVVAPAYLTLLHFILRCTLMHNIINIHYK